MDFTVQLQTYRLRVEQLLRDRLPTADTPPSRLHTAMRYSVEAGGKRLRPILVLAAADLFDVHPKTAESAALAVECVHTYSLIHDDLPCMDNDDLRRGRPTAHRQFDEATALLAGDALLTFAFFTLSFYEDRPLIATKLLFELSLAAGGEQMVGGQMEDLLAEKKSRITEAELREIHRKKTAGLIASSLAMGGIVADAETEHVDLLRDAGECLGMAFQIMDDVLDATADAATLGKTPGKDARNNKATYVKLLGLDGARARAREECEIALEKLAQLPGDTSFLATLVRNMAERTH